MQICELTVFLVVAIMLFTKIVGLLRLGIKMKQRKLANDGQAIGFIGMLVAGVLPQTVGIQYGASDKAQLIEVLLFLIGFWLIIIGLQVILAYKTEEDIPHWMKTISHLWR